MSERNYMMVKDTKPDDSCEFLRLMLDSATGKQAGKGQKFSGASVIEDEDIFEELHDTTNGAFADKGASVDRLRDKFDSIGLVERIQK